MTAADAYSIRWGQQSPIPPRLVYRTRPEHLEVALDADRLHDPVDFGDECVVEDARTGAPVFTGTVEVHRHAADLIVLSLADRSQPMKEGMLRGFVTKPGSSGLRLLHALLRAFGTPDD